jgi:hypothetical protein
MVLQRGSITVTVVETVTETDLVEIICPDVIHPGEYFTCVADIPTGTDLKATVIMSDDLNGDTDGTELLHVPSKT